MAHKRPVKKPILPTKPKRPMKPIPEEEGVGELPETPEIPGVQHNYEDEDSDGSDIDMLRDSALRRLRRMHFVVELMATIYIYTTLVSHGLVRHRPDMHTLFLKQLHLFRRLLSH